MRAQRFVVTAAALFLLMPLASGTVASEPASPDGSASSGECVAGAAYDPACDVNHDGAIDIMDIGLDP